MVSKLRSYALNGIDALDVQVEVDVLPGAINFEVVGLPDMAVREARNRVRSAIRNSGLSFPLGRVTVNLAPADLKKNGTVYDLPILLGVLMSGGSLDADVSDSAFIGEVSLSGELSPINGVLSMALRAKQTGIRRLYLPADNAGEACVVGGIEILPVHDILQLLEHLTGGKQIEPTPNIPFESVDDRYFVDYAEVRGQAAAVRAMEIAAAGGHNILLIGPPGTGKSMLAKRLPTILPALSFEEAIDTTRIYSVAGRLPSDTPILRTRPFRSPHHGVSKVGLVGGGNPAIPGEISFAHNGVLFLDELPEFQRDAKESLRQPLEDGVTSIVRAGSSAEFPSSFMLVAAMNPCPCGYYGHPTRKCSCSSKAVQSYLAKVSGPLLDRMDLRIEVGPVEYSDLADTTPSESSAAIRERVNAARQRQLARFAGTGILCNARITPRYMQQFCQMTPAAEKFLEKAFARLQLNPRSYTRILQVARTIADLAARDMIDTQDIAEAVQYHALEDKFWPAPSAGPSRDRK